MFHRLVNEIVFRVIIKPTARYCRYDGETNDRVAGYWAAGL